MNKFRKESGFTLVEMLIVIIVLSIGLVGLASAMVSMTQYQLLAASRAEMTQLADSKLEQLGGAAAAANGDTIQLKIGGSLTTAAAPHTSTATGSSGRTYVMLWTVAAGPGTSRDVVLRIKPQVDVPQTPAKLDFSTLIAFRQ
jgi:prepilin-type N-terminal cleavage/methylation domain-containing protein